MYELYIKWVTLFILEVDKTNETLLQVMKMIEELKKQTEEQEEEIGALKGMYRLNECYGLLLLRNYYYLNVLYQYMY